MINRILIVGLGSIGRRHLRLARELFPNAEIRVLRHQECSEVPDYSNGCFTDVDKAIEFAPDVAVIANPAPFHTAVAQRLACLGTHLLIEKPIAASITGVEDLLESIDKLGTVLLIGYNLRFLPSLQKFRALLAEQEIGKVLSVRSEVGQYLPSWRPDADYRKSISAQSTLGGGVLLELSHEIDYMRWIFGEVERVTAHIGRQSNLDIDVEDTAHLIFSFARDENGYELIGTLNMDFVRHDTTRLCTAVGERGSLRWNGITGIVEKFEVGAKEWRKIFHHQPQRDDSYIAEWRHLLECIDKQKTPLISGQDGLIVLQIIDAICQASKTGVQTQVAKECVKKEVIE